MTRVALVSGAAQGIGRGIDERLAAGGFAVGVADLNLDGARGWDDLMPFVDTDEAFWDKVIDINYKGALRMTHAVLPLMLEADWGRIVDIGSDAGRLGSSMESVDSGTKGAIIAFTKTIARESARKGVTANCVCPGPTDTPALRVIAESHADAESVMGHPDPASSLLRLSVRVCRVRRPISS